MDLQKEISNYSWYQSIDFWDGISSRGCLWCGDPAWGLMKLFLPKTLKGKRILDIGSNAGIFCIRAALMGAKEVIGIESNDWKKDDKYLEQAYFVKKVFEKKHNGKLPITYINDRMENVLEDKSIGKFDVVFAIGSLYYSKKQDETVKNIARITNNAIVRVREDNRIRRFNELFVRHGFKHAGLIEERWEEILKVPADDFHLFHFLKGKAWRNRRKLQSIKGVEY